jgi:hypothetical protein
MEFQKGHAAKLSTASIDNTGDQEKNAASPFLHPEESGALLEEDAVRGPR